MVHAITTVISLWIIDLRNQFTSGSLILIRSVNCNTYFFIYVVPFKVIVFAAISVIVRNANYYPWTFIFIKNISIFTSNITFRCSKICKLYLIYSFFRGNYIWNSVYGICHYAIIGSFSGVFSRRHICCFRSTFNFSIYNIRSISSC